ncbi:MAG TPA: D-2-hydroxyacid dehydrogenase [Xanthomonadales bacterium]|nr:D-2-hydroxyacid dehydrogenase [Xanthomonadales bacterium]
MQEALLQRGVFLDLETVQRGDLNLDHLERCLPAWQWHEFSEADDIPGRIARANVVVTNKCVLSRGVLSAAPSLRLVALAATGSNNVDLDAAAELGIAVCNIRNYASDAVAQHTITLMLNLLSGQPWYWQSVIAGEWSRARQFCLQDRPIRQARGLSFAVIGHGVLGKATAELARALGMNVLLAERKGVNPRPGRVSFDEAIARADVISLHCPLSEATRGLVDGEVLSRMKKEALLINTARGEVVNESDLADALRQGEIAGAAIDTLSQEPPPQDHVLLAHDIPNLIVTPLNAWASQTARQAAIDQLAEVLNAFAAGKPMNLLVPPSEDSGSKPGS